MDQENNQNNWSKVLLEYLEKFGLFLLELVKVSVLAGITIALVRYFLFKPFYVKGESMVPNFHDKEYLIIDELTYRFKTPERGQVIVFKYPDNPKEYFLKRVIALPGERVKIASGKVTIYNQEHPEGVVLDESYLPNDSVTSGEIIKVVGEDEFYVLGDNRPNSYDSRRFGPIKKDFIIGRVLLRGWPFNRAELFGTPMYDYNN